MTEDSAQNQKTVYLLHVNKKNDTPKGKKLSKFIKAILKITLIDAKFYFSIYTKSFTEQCFFVVCV